MMSERHKNQTGTYFDNYRGSYNNAHPDAYDNDKIKLLLTLTESIISNKSLKVNQNSQ